MRVVKTFDYECGTFIIYLQHSLSSWPAGRLGQIGSGGRSVVWQGSSFTFISPACLFGIFGTLNSQTLLLLRVFSTFTLSKLLFALTDRGGNDSSGNEGNLGYTDGQNSDPQNSPPRDKDYLRGQQQQMHQQLTPVSSITGNMSSIGGTPSQPQIEKRSRLFRTSSNTPAATVAVVGGNSGAAAGGAGGGGGKRKHTLSLSSSEPRSALETCLSPTNVEPRKMLLDQLSRVFAGDDNVIPEVVTIISPPEALGGSALLAKLVTLFGNSFKPAFVPQNTAEVKAVLQALMAKIQK